MSKPVLVVGVGGEGPESLATPVRERIALADQLWGSERLLSRWNGHRAEKVVIRSGVDTLVRGLRHRGEEQVVVLASGDPGFYGIAETILRHLGPQEVEIVPHVTSLQLAFARAGVTWSDAVFTSAHARPLDEVVGWARRAAKLGVLTDRQQTPAVIARSLLAAGLPDCRAIVAENLGLPDERLVDTRLVNLPHLEFAALNVLLLVQDPGWRPPPVLAIRPDDDYAHRRGLITKADVRALSLARLQLREDDVVWDVGAGSGAVSIEMAGVAWRGKVYAVEMDAENAGYIRENVARFGVPNVELVGGKAPEALAGLTAPTAVFIGGTGGEMEAVLTRISLVSSPGCRVVASLVTLENLHAAATWMQARGWSPQITQVSVAQGKDIAGMTRLEGQNPVFILAGTVA